MKRTKTRVALLGAPTSGGACVAGTEMGPTALRLGGLVPMLEALGHEVVDHGDLPLDDERQENACRPIRGRDAARIAASTQALACAAHRLMRSGAMPVFLGGDHSISMGTVNGVARHVAEEGRPLFLLWLDAHADFNTPETSLTGNMHGMALAFLCGEHTLQPMREGGWLGRVTDPRNVWLFGTRSIDPAEGPLLRKHGLSVIDMTHIATEGVQNPLGRVLDAVAVAKGVLHVSVDVDFLDPAVAPGVGTPVPNGVTYEQALLIMEMLNASQLVGSVDVVELNPLLDPNGASVGVINDLVAALFGRSLHHGCAKHLPKERLC